MTRRLAAVVLIACLAMAASSSVLAQDGVQQTIRYAEVVSMEKTIVKVKPSTTGTQVGATAGAVAGYALAGGRDRWIGGLLGGVLGGAAGRAADKKASKKKGWQLIVKLEDTGNEIGVQVVGKKVDYKVGDRVRLLTGAGGQTQVSRVEG